MSGLVFLGVMAAAAGTAVAVGVRAMAEVVLVRRRLRTPLGPLDQLRDGQRGATVGVVARGPERTAPLSGRSCVTWRLEVQPYQVDAGRSLRLQRGGDLVVREGATDVVIDTGGAELWLERAPVEWMGALEEQPGLLAALGQEVASDPAWSPSTRVICREWVFAQGDRIGAYGRVRFEVDPDGAGGAGGYRDSFSNRVRLIGTKRRPLIVADDPPPRAD